MPSLTGLLYALTNALLAPLVAALLALAAYALLVAGGLAREACERQRRSRFFRAWRSLSGNGAGASVTDLPRVGGFLAIAAEERASSGRVDFDSLHLRAERSLLPLKLIARLGPILGLAGTLVPLGPSLQAYASGDTRSLSEGLVIAFSTTVIGLLVGGVGYTAYAIRRQWYTEDLNASKNLVSEADRGA